MSRAVLIYARTERHPASNFFSELRRWISRWPLDSRRNRWYIQEVASKPGAV